MMFRPSPSSLPRLGLFLNLIVAVAGDSLDLGNLDQSKGKDSGTHDLTGTSLWVSGQDGRGFDVTLSSDLQSKIKQTLQGGPCKDKADPNGCFQAIKTVVTSGDLMVDDQLEKRAFYGLVSRTFGVIAGLSAAVAFFAWAVDYMNHRESDGLTVVHPYIAPQIASQVGAIKTGVPVTVSADGTSLAVVTINPEATAPPAGAAVPTVSPVTSASGQYKVGDVIVNIDPAEARRISDLMSQMGCHGDDNKKTKKGKRSFASGVAAAQCGATSILQQVGPGGAMNELRGVRLVGPPLVFGVPEVARAANEVLNTVRELAPVVQLDPAFVEQLAMIIFALGLQIFVDHVALGAVNWIHGSTLTSRPDATATITTSKASCSSKQCVASCGERGMIEYCETSCTTISSCAQGKPSVQVVSTTTTSTYDWPLLSDSAQKPLQTATPPSNLQCDQKTNSGFPQNLFNGPDSKVYTEFCKTWSQGSSQSWVVNAQGTKLSGKRKRSPPSDPSQFSQYSVDLSFTPSSDKNKKCSVKSCEEAFATLGQCKNNGANPQVMYNEATLDVGCGTYAYKIEGTGQPRPYIPTPDRNYVIYLYTWNPSGGWWSWDILFGEAGQPADPCNPGGSLTRDDTNNIDVKNIDGEWDRIPYPPADVTYSKREDVKLGLYRRAAQSFGSGQGSGVWKGCTYKKFDDGKWKGDAVGNIQCGDKTYNCERKKADPISTQCKNSDGVTLTKVKALECYM